MATSAVRLTIGGRLRGGPSLRCALERRTGGIRRIVVDGRTGEGAVRRSPNEWPILAENRWPNHGRELTGPTPDLS